MRVVVTVMLFLSSFLLFSQPDTSIFRAHTQVTMSNGRAFLEYKGQRILESSNFPPYTLSRMQGNPVGTDQGIAFDFGQGFEGKLYYGFIPYGDTRHPHPVYFRSPVNIRDGKAEVRITGMGGTYDMVAWQQQGQGVVGYRVTDESGQMLYDGIIQFKGKGPFDVITTVIEGPFINCLTHQGAIISFTTNMPVKPAVVVGGKRFEAATEGTLHEIPVTGLQSARDYPYELHYGGMVLRFNFRTAPKPGSRQPFSFTYASDSRAGQGGGERNVWGSNNYIMKKIMALGQMKQARFMQFTGDLINGYLINKDNMHLQYANWKRAIQPFAHYAPMYAGMGNHEALIHRFEYREGEETTVFQVDRAPYATESAEAVFAANFVNPQNGPDSEDGAVYDPNPDQLDFPSYKENVYYYTYDNVAVIVLNSDYWYAPTTARIPYTSGGMHGYVMDMQLKWLEETVARLEGEKSVDHIFVTTHTPFFPNGGHVKDDMWYGGNNEMRPYVMGKAVEKGIIERRDQLLDVLVNRSRKVRAILTGDEHNYNRLLLTPETVIYPEGYAYPKIKLSRTIYQINNGAAGAPYYAQEQTPWTSFVSGFTTQHALVFFHVKGRKISVEVLNPDTLEEVDRFTLVTSGK
jgi:hypothetical protein